MRKYCLALCVLLACAAPAAAQITLPYPLFVAGTTISPDEVNANFDKLATDACNRTGCTITGNVTVNAAVTFDGVDVGAWLGQNISTGASPAFAAATIAGTLAANAITSTTSVSSATVVATGAITGASVATTGDVTAGDQLFERGRAVAVGEWADVSYTAGNFTASAGNWTVDAGDLQVFAYTLIGKTMTVTVVILASDVSTTPSSLYVLIPASKTAAKSAVGTGVVYDAGGSGALGLIQATSFDTRLAVQKPSANWTATSGDNTTIYFTFTFEVQ